VPKLVSLDPVVRGLFPQVKQLVRLTIPGSSAEAERSFSGLRRLKTYLRNSMGHARFNHLAILHVHQTMMDGIDLVAIARNLSVDLIPDQPRLGTNLKC
jgi:hAT family C-terminal dimerisation region